MVRDYLDGAGMVRGRERRRPERASIVSGFSAERFRDVAGRFASGVTVITGVDEDGPVGFTCQSFHALSLDPPMVVFAVAHTSTSWPRIRKSGRCCVNVLADSQEEVARTFAMSGIDKFASQAWSPAEDGNPILEGVLAWFSCTVTGIHPGGDHEVVTCDVHSIDATDREPLVFHRGRYSGLTDLGGA
jgi:3-hydroxy-9,10-secoandrosta-1,3,5(10)-triene-9,17-dione monooxygenase reductase component